MRVLAPVLLSLLLVTSSLGQGCNPGWSLYNGHCYKHFNDPNNRVAYPIAQMRCQQFKGRLTDVRDLNELLFLGKLVHTEGAFKMSDLPLVGLYKTERDNPINVFDGSKPYVKWCPTVEPNNYQGRENCIVIVADKGAFDGEPINPVPNPPCMRDLFCDGTNSHPGGYSRYVCKAPLQVVCDKPNTEAFNGTCVCKKDYIDITETDVPEKEKYKRGEKCISKDPCKDVRDLSVNFLVDSSESIGADNWDSLISFLKSGSNYLPSTSRVGFVKFSTNITFAKFLGSGWTKAEYERFVPSSYDKGDTNTPAAFEKATSMFRKDKSRNQVAVLITDGLPFDGLLDEKEVQKKSKDAARKLRAKGISLIALGYGKDLDSKKIQVIRSWLEDPEEDYFEYHKNACDLKSVHMCLLMRKICRRAVSY